MEPITLPILILPAYTDAAENTYSAAVATVVRFVFAPIDEGASVTWYVYASKQALTDKLDGTNAAVADIGEFTAPLSGETLITTYAGLIAGTVPLGAAIAATAQGITALAGGVADSVTFTPPTGS